MDLWTKVLCTLHRHPVQEINDPPGEYTVFVTCPCAKRVVNNPLPPTPRERPVPKERPRLTRVQIIDSLLQVAKPPPLADPEEWLAAEVAKVEMAEALGRALHRAREIGGPWGAPCSRAVMDGDVQRMEPVSYGYDGGFYECECPQMGAHLVDLMEQDAKQQRADDSGLVTPKVMH